jgi:hypothetical protein
METGKYATMCAIVRNICKPGAHSMFVRNNPQQSLFQPHLTLPERLRKKLVASWAEVFRNDVLVHIPEDALPGR